jgi:RHS repeat-associated protein
VAAIGSAYLTNKSYSDGTTPSVAYTYDRLGHVISNVETFVGPSTITTGLQYNVAGKLTQETFDSSYFAGRQLIYQLDTTNTGTLGRTIGYELGTSGSPYGDQGVSYNYDSTGRFDYACFYGTPAFTYNFVSNSNLISSITDSADGWSQTRTWDPNRDLMDSIQTSVSGVTEGSFSYVYDSIGRRTSKLETGTLFARYPAGGLVDTYSYDTESEVTGDQAYQSVNPTSPTTPVVGRGFTFTYDPIGNRITSTVDSLTSQQTTYTSNALNQISSRTVPGYYPVSGLAPGGANTVTLNGSSIPSGQFAGQFYAQSVTVSNSTAPVWGSAQLSSSLGGSTTANAFVPQNPENCTYDADGNLLSDGRWDYVWDAENRLTRVTTYGSLAGDGLSVWNSGVPLVSTTFIYDYRGRRIFKGVKNWTGSAWTRIAVTYYLYSNWNLIAEYSANPTTAAITGLAHSYLWGLDLSGTTHGSGGVGGLLAMYDAASGDYELPIHDANGNVHGLTDRTSGQLTAEYEYSPFGQTLRSNGTFSQANPFRFSTKYTDNETDLINYGRRHYNPALGRFLGRDPIEEKGGLHLYAFVKNRPTNNWDKNGLLLGGVTVAGSYQAGLPILGAGGQGSFSYVGYTGNGGSVNAGNSVLLSGGGYYNVAGDSQSFPSSGQYAGGAQFDGGLTAAGSGSLGVGFIYSYSANSGQDLVGAAQQGSFSIGPLSGSVSVGTNSTGQIETVYSLTIGGTVGAAFSAAYNAVETASIDFNTPYVFSTPPNGLDPTSIAPSTDPSPSTPVDPSSQPPGAPPLPDSPAQTEPATTTTDSTPNTAGLTPPVAPPLPDDDTPDPSLFDENTGTTTYVEDTSEDDDNTTAVTGQATGQATGGGVGWLGPHPAN